jgi:hypothetical protein
VGHQSLHPNAGAQLRKEIFLLPDNLIAPTPSHTEGIHVDDHMHIVPITDPVQVVDDISEDSLSNSDETGENLSTNGADTDNQKI